MAESSMGGRFWFRAMLLDKGAQNAPLSNNLSRLTRVRTTPHHYYVFEKPENISIFRAFWCRAFMYLSEDRREKGKYLPTANAEGIYLGFVSNCNTSGNVIHFPSKEKTLISNQILFNETNLQYRKQSIVDRHIEDEHVNILKEEGAANWESYDKSLLDGSYEKLHYFPALDELILKVVGKDNTY